MTRHTEQTYNQRTLSGANVAIVVTAAVLLARWGGVRGAAVPVLAVVSTVGFVLLARPDPSVLRAAVMGTVAVLAVAVGGRRPGQAALFARRVHSWVHNATGREPPSRLVPTLTCTNIRRDDRV